MSKLEMAFWSMITGMVILAVAIPIILYYSDQPGKDICEAQVNVVSCKMLINLEAVWYIDEVVE